MASRRNRAGSSPPSPVLLRPPIRFMAMASDSWASLLMLPKLMAPVQNRLTISAAGSTISRGIGLRPALISSSPRKVQSCRLSSLRRRQTPCSWNSLLLEGVLELLDGLRVPHVMLAPATPHDFTAAVELRQLRTGGARDSRPRRRCSASRAMIVQADALDPAGRAREVLVDHRAAQADGLEHLGAAIAQQRADPHLAEDLEQPRIDGLAIVLHRLGKFQRSRLADRGASALAPDLRRSRRRDRD